MSDFDQHESSLKYCYIYRDPLGGLSVNVSADPIRSIRAEGRDETSLIAVEAFHTWEGALVRAEKLLSLSSEELAAEALEICQLFNPIDRDLLAFESRATHHDWMDTLYRDRPDDWDEPGPDGFGGTRCPVPGGPVAPPPSLSWSQRNALPTGAGAP